METPSPYLRDLAQRLLAQEAARQGESQPQVAEAAVLEKLRVALTVLTGGDGFAALLRRAVALATAEAPELAGVKLTADRRLEGIEGIGPDAAIVLAAHVLGLLVTFIGQPLTLRLLREAWPDARLEA